MLIAIRSEYILHIFYLMMGRSVVPLSPRRARSRKLSFHRTRMLSNWCTEVWPGARPQTGYFFSPPIETCRHKSIEQPFLSSDFHSEAAAKLASPDITNERYEKQQVTSIVSFAANLVAFSSFALPKHFELRNYWDHGQISFFCLIFSMSKWIIRNCENCRKGSSILANISLFQTTLQLSRNNNAKNVRIRCSNGVEKSCQSWKFCQFWKS